MRRLLFLLALTLPAQAQWQLQQSNTTADLRGIHSVGNGVAWASGSKGTVLRTTDNGTNWQLCAIPLGAEALDFRGIQAFDAQTAIVMSSGKGDLSRLYKTTDACKTWKLVFTNPDPEGFWDALQFDTRKKSTLLGAQSPEFGVLVGDPVNRHFPIFLSRDYGDHWERQIRESPMAEEGGESLFAASNSALFVSGVNQRRFVTGGKGGPRELWFWVGGDDSGVEDALNVAKGARPFRYVTRGWELETLPSKSLQESSGAFSVASNYVDYTEVVVGGDYSRPNERRDTAWYQGRYRRWTAATTPPHGYRSAVTYHPAKKAWITVGPNGTDASTDDGRNWHALRPGPSEAPDSDKQWNALSLPFVVGPKGRIGILRPDALVKP